MAHPNEEVLRNAYAAFARGDLDCYLGNRTNDITFHVPGHTNSRATIRVSNSVQA